MLGTPIILFESPSSRILSNFLPMFAINGPQDFGRLIPSIIWADAASLLFCAGLWWRYRERATPFLVTGGFVAAQMLAMGTMGGIGWLGSLLRVIGEAPSAAVVGLGVAIGAATIWAGWNAGKRKVESAGAMAVAA